MEIKMVYLLPVFSLFPLLLTFLWPEITLGLDITEKDNWETTKEKLEALKKSSKKKKEEIDKAWVLNNIKIVNQDNWTEAQKEMLEKWIKNKVKTKEEIHFRDLGQVIGKSVKIVTNDVVPLQDPRQNLAMTTTLSSIFNKCQPDNPSAPAIDLVLTEELKNEFRKQNLSWYDVKRLCPEMVLNLNQNLALQGNIGICLTQPNNAVDNLSTDIKDILSSLENEGGKTIKKLRSLGFDDELMGELIQMQVTQNEKVPDLEKLNMAKTIREMIIVGSQIFEKIKNLNANSPKYEEERQKIYQQCLDANYDSEKVMAAIGWYLQAKAGKDFVFNPISFEKERNFISGGTYRFFDPDGKMYDFMKNLDKKVYDRKSSHYAEETLGSQKGFDFSDENMKNKFILPGKSGTKTTLFGEIRIDQDRNNPKEMFIKFETEGVGLSNPKGTIKHGLNYFEHSKREASGTNVDPYSHRETTVAQIKNFISDYYGKMIEAKNNKSEKDNLKAQMEDSLGFGVDKTIKNLANNPSDEARQLTGILKEYKKLFCAGGGSGIAPQDNTNVPVVKLERLKGCEVILDVLH